MGGERGRGIYSPPSAPLLGFGVGSSCVLYRRLLLLGQGLSHIQLSPGSGNTTPSFTPSPSRLELVTTFFCG